MSKGISCSCKGTKDERINNWRIIQYKCNHSAFNGSKETASDYSSFRCIRCRAVWRSKSDYVYTVKARNGDKDPWEEYVWKEGEQTNLKEKKYHSTNYRDRFYRDNKAE